MAKVKCPKSELGRTVCAQVLIDSFREVGEKDGNGCEVIVSVSPPPLSTPYTGNAFRCDHGQVYYVHPTAGQIARWREDEVP